MKRLRIDSLFIIREKNQVLANYSFNEKIELGQYILEVDKRTFSIKIVGFGTARKKEGIDQKYLVLTMEREQFNLLLEKGLLIEGDIFILPTKPCR
ncbi:hypothetical protein [Thermospira aquatica]|uniref:Uncharacterized protein n=1 Tax=Thermospira aquatica TaxID=2828656 RepID=A0AAX3BE97_9SPIR|nr:hypothetical protein [Thermospira aquatica]URA10622.1 hypothetical protein KDW03_02115 [Thermospira aquatica]